MARGRGIAAAALVAAFAVTADAARVSRKPLNNVGNSAAYKAAAKSIYWASGKFEPTALITCGQTEDGPRATLDVSGAVVAGVPVTTLDVATALFFAKTYVNYQSGSSTSESSANWDYGEPWKGKWSTDTYYSDSSADVLDKAVDYVISTDEIYYNGLDVSVGVERLWNALVPLAMHATASNMPGGYRTAAIANALISGGCTINGNLLPTDFNTPVTVGDCVAPQILAGWSTSTTTTTSSSSDAGAFGDVVTDFVNTGYVASEDIINVNQVCVFNLACPALELNTRWARPSSTSNYDRNRPFLFGGYACPADELLKCDAVKNNMVALPNGSGCIGMPGYYYYDEATGSSVDTTGLVVAGKCNSAGSNTAAHSGGNSGLCQCYTGYTGPSCSQCEPGYLSTLVMLGDGVHSMTAVGELYHNGRASDMHDYINGPLHLDYETTRYNGRNGGVFCVKDPNPAPMQPSEE